MGKTVFILGAGATRGCSFVAEQKRNGHCIPPLDTDYFTQLQRVTSETHAPRIKRLVARMVQWFGPNYMLGMERVFCHLEQAEKMLKHLQKDLGKDYPNVSEFKRDLEQSIAIILGASLTETRGSGKGSYENKQCEYHDKLVRDLARKQDAFITFNYDCVLDDSLKRFGGNKWNPKYGYGFKLGPKGKGIEGYQYWVPEVPSLATERDTLLVHKVHGSLHFRFIKSDNSVSLKQRPYANPHGKDGNMNFEIIPPESAKAYEAGRFGEIMKNAYSSLRGASNVVVIGYSLPPSDQHAEALLRFGVKKKALESLVVVNPDSDVRKRIRSSLSSGLKDSTRVLSFDYLHEFVNADTRLWRST